MKYRVDFTEKRPSKYIEGSKELVKFLKGMKSGDIEDIRKVLNSGATDGVYDSYRRYMK